MSNLIRTTITIPENLFDQAKVLAAAKGASLSSFIVDILNERIKGKIKVKKYKNPLDTLGQFSIGIKLAYKNRGDLYDDYLKRKMGV